MEGRAPPLAGTKRALAACSWHIKVQEHTRSMQGVPQCKGAGACKHPSLPALGTSGHRSIRAVRDADKSIQVHTGDLYKSKQGMLLCIHVQRAVGTPSVSQPTCLFTQLCSLAASPCKRSTEAAPASCQLYHALSLNLTYI
eukprot:1149489-Pelagomonas_calceolata.AAC.3